LEKDGVPQADIYGYENEEYTHTAVAAQIAGGNADAGMGIYAAAKIFDLDFIPITNEEYDFLVKTNTLSQPSVQAFLEILRSDTLKSSLEDLGGYAFG
jgi:putative molybdopterin biosynthesis protein